MKFYCELRACLVLEDAINFRFFPGLFHNLKLLAKGRRRSVPGMLLCYVNRIRTTHIYIQTDFCV